MGMEKLETIKEVPFYEFMVEIWSKYVANKGVSAKTGIVAKDGKVNMRWVQDHYDPSRPYMMAYYLIHGDYDLIGSDVSMWNRENSEPIFKRALDEGKTWQEVTGYKPPKKNELI